MCATREVSFVYVGYYCLPLFIINPPFKECWKGNKFYPCPAGQFWSAHLLNCMEYIHESYQIAKSYQDKVSQTRKTSLANSFSGP